MRLHQLAAHLLLLLLGGLLLPVRGEAAGEVRPRLLCTPNPVQVTSFADMDVSITPGSLVVVDGSSDPRDQVLFFVSTEMSGPTTLWKVTHDQAGNPVLTSILTRPAGQILTRLTAAYRRLYFVVNEGARITLWAVDVDQTEARPLFENAALLDGTGFAAMGSALFFMASTPESGAELWRIDGTPGSAQLVQDIYSGPLDSFPLELTVLNGVLYFRANDGISGDELWRSDGAANSTDTRRVKDIRSGGDGSIPSSLRVMGEKLYFTAATGGQAELWVSDGTPGGTLPIESFAGAPNHTAPQDLTVAGNKLYFSMDDQDRYGQELWVSNGTVGGTQMVKDLHPGTPASMPEKLTAVGETLFFMANDGVVGRELWKTDGTAAGTVLAKEFFPRGDGSLGGEELASGAGGLLVSIDSFDEDATVQVGRQLWRVNRTGTEQMTNISSAPEGSSPHSMVVVGNRLYFAAMYPSAGHELVTLPLGQVDCVPPEIVCPAEVRLEAVNASGVTMWSPSIVEKKDDSLTLLKETPAPGFTNFSVGSTPVTLAVEDAAYNRATCTVTVTVSDRTAPALVCPSRLVQEATGPQGAHVSYPVQVRDAVDASPMVTYDPASGSLFPLEQETVVEARASDASLNARTCQFTVVVKDTVPPTLTCPQSVVRVATSAAPALIEYAEPEARDVVSGELPVVPSRPLAGPFDVGEWPVSVTAEDAAGNRATCTFTVYNLDAVAPTITCPGAQRVVAADSDGVAVLFEAKATDDLVEELPISYSHEPGSTFPVGETIVTATARDLGGNEASCSFPVTVAERSGCGCQSGSAGAGLFWLVLSLVPLWARRRTGRLAR